MAKKIVKVSRCVTQQLKVIQIQDEQIGADEDI